MAKFDSATFEEVNAEVESLDLQAYATAEAVAVESVAGIRETVCEIYQVVRKILNLVKLILPPKWRAVIETFIQIMDWICG